MPRRRSAIPFPPSLIGRNDNRRMNSSVSPNGIARLGYFGCIRVTGPDASAFLQSQLTSDFASLHAGRARLAGFCSAKGRLQASFFGWKQGEDIVLLCAADLLAATLKRMSMFVLRMKCKLSDATQELPVFGLAGADDDGPLTSLSIWEVHETADGTLIRLLDAQGQALGLWLPRRDALALPNLPVLSQDAWRWLQISSGVPVVEATTVDMFVPQMINFEILGGIDFQKGCYPGQEVVARSQYRGTLKRRMFLFDCDIGVSAGQEVFGTVDPAQPAGVVANAAPAPYGPGSRALVELKMSELQRGTLHLGHSDGAVLTQRDLPYPIAISSAESG
jgi:tRNA-modifying protein YgfZ